MLHLSVAAGGYSRVKQERRHIKLSQGTRRMLGALVISFVFHGLLFILVPKFFTEKSHNKAIQVWLSEPPKKPAEVGSKKTVVKTPAVSLQERPKKAQYLAEQDHTSAREMQAKPAKLQENQRNQQPPATDDSVLDAPLPKIGRHTSKKNRSANDPLGIKPQFHNDAPMPPSSDYLPHVAQGEATDLNTQMWRHAPFFNRIKARIGQIWSPQTQIALHDPQGHLLGTLDRATVLSITIDREGRLIELKVQNPSGVAYLDDEAERTLKEATPFLYPPEELFLDSDRFSFTFAFHLHVNRGFSFDFDW